MFKPAKAACCLLVGAACAAGSAGCSPPAPPDYGCEVYPISYEQVKSVDNVDAWAGEAATNLPVENGVVLSPYFTMTVNGVSLPVYAARTANGAHSFACVDVLPENGEEFRLAVSVEVSEKASVLDKKGSEVIVLPASRGVEAALEGRRVSCEITWYGSYSLVFNGSHVEPLTLIARPKQSREDIVPEGYEVRYLDPGEYAQSATTFTDANTVYWFKPGRYRTDCITLPSDCVLYLESGAYLEVLPAPAGVTPSLCSDKAERVRVMGRGLLDYSACCGGEVPEGYFNNKSGLVFSETDDILFEGITVVNSNTWTLCFNDCEGVTVRDCLFLGYRVWSDGVMLSDCKNAVVERCFARTGDDAFETKSTTAKGLTDNVVFRDNAAWTDKAVAYGCIYESNHDTQNVTFENCSVGFSLATWSPHLGCCVVQMGDRKGAVMSDITFRNIEVYATYNALCNVYIGGSGGRGAGYGTVRDIYFSDITAQKNYHYVVNLRTYDNENCFIGDLYFDNIISNGVRLSPDNVADLVKIAANYDLEKLHIDTRTEG